MLPPHTLSFFKNSYQDYHWGSGLSDPCDIIVVGKW